MHAQYPPYAQPTDPAAPSTATFHHQTAAAYANSPAFGESARPRTPSSATSPSTAMHGFGVTEPPAAGGRPFNPHGAIGALAAGQQQPLSLNLPSGPANTWEYNAAKAMSPTSLHGTIEPLAASRMGVMRKPPHAIGLNVDMMRARSASPALLSPASPTLSVASYYSETPVSSMAPGSGRRPSLNTRAPTNLGMTRLCDLLLNGPPDTLQNQKQLQQQQQQQQEQPMQNMSPTKPQEHLATTAVPVEHLNSPAQSTAVIANAEGDNTQLISPQSEPATLEEQVHTMPQEAPSSSPSQAVLSQQQVQQQSVDLDAEKENPGSAAASITSLEVSTRDVATASPDATITFENIPTDILLRAASEMALPESIALSPSGSKKVDSDNDETITAVDSAIALDSSASSSEPSVVAESAATVQFGGEEANPLTKHMLTLSLQDSADPSPYHATDLQLDRSTKWTTLPQELFASIAIPNLAEASRETAEHDDVSSVDSSSEPGISTSTNMSSQPHTTAGKPGPCSFLHKLVPSSAKQQQQQQHQQHQQQQQQQKQARNPELATATTGQKKAMSSTIKLSEKLAWLEAAKQRIAELDEVQQLPKLLTGWHADVSSLAAALEATEKRLHDAEQRATAAEHRAAQLQQGLGAQLGTVAHLRSECDRHTSYRAALERQVSELRNDSQMRAAMAAQLAHRLQQQQAETDAVRADARALRVRAADADARSAQLRADLDAWVARARALEAHAAQATATQAELARMRAHFARLIEQKDRELGRVIANMCFVCRRNVGTTF